jgi:hypothetical protein
VVVTIGARRGRGVEVTAEDDRRRRSDVVDQGEEPGGIIAAGCGRAVAFEMHAHHHDRHAGDGDDCAEGDRAADARLVARPVEPLAARLDPDQEWPRQRRVAGDGRAMEADEIRFSFTSPSSSSRYSTA